MVKPLVWKHLRRKVKRTKAAEKDDAESGEQGAKHMKEKEIGNYLIITNYKLNWKNGV